jgi:hypothetical protein
MSDERDIGWAIKAVELGERVRCSGGLLKGMRQL